MVLDFYPDQPEHWDLYEKADSLLMGGHRNTAELLEWR